MKRNLIFSFLAAFFLCLPLSVAAQKQNGHARQQKSVKKELCLQLYSVRDLVHDINKDGKADMVFNFAAKDLAKFMIPGTVYDFWLYTVNGKTRITGFDTALVAPDGYKPQKAKSETHDR